jgi:hypothetical protein
MNIITQRLLFSGYQNFIQQKDKVTKQQQLNQSSSPLRSSIQGRRLYYEVRIVVSLSGYLEFFVLITSHNINIPMSE